MNCPRPRATRNNSARTLRAVHYVSPRARAKSHSRRDRSTARVRAAVAPSAIAANAASNATTRKGQAAPGGCRRGLQDACSNHSIGSRACRRSANMRPGRGAVADDSPDAAHGSARARAAGCNLQTLRVRATNNPKVRGSTAAIRRAPIHAAAVHPPRTNALEEQADRFLVLQAPAAAATRRDATSAKRYAYNRARERDLPTTPAPSPLVVREFQNATPCFGIAGARLPVATLANAFPATRAEARSIGR